MTRQPRIPSYRLHKPSGQAVVTLGGKDVYLGKHDTDASREAYERAVLAYRTHGQVVPRRAVNLPVSVAGMVARYWLHADATGLYMKNGRKTSERSCMAVALRPLLKLYGSTPAADFGPKALKEVRELLCKPLPPSDDDKGRRTHHGPRARTSVNKHVHRIRSVFRWAVSEELVPASVWEALRSVPALRRGAPGVAADGKVGPAPMRSVAAVLRIVRPDIAAIVKLQWLTGARPGEIVQMRMGDIDRSRPVWIYRPGSHKNEHRGQDRTIMIGPKAQQVLVPFVKADPSAWLFPGRKQHLGENVYAGIIRAACLEARVEPWTPHQLRHNRATSARSTHGIDTAGTVLGHANIATTEIYAEKDLQKAIAYALKHG